MGKYSARYADQPEQISSGTLTGLAWSLGDVSPGGWWQVEFKVVVQDSAAVVDAAVVYDYGKTSWMTSEEQQSSARDIAALTYAEPDLTAAKSVISTPANPGAGQDWGYRITLTNTGTAAARNVLVTDTLPSGMRNYDPTTGTVTVTRGATTLTLGTDYTLNYTPATGVFLIDFDNGGAIRTEIPAPPSADSVVTIDYTSRVDSTVGAGASLTNNVQRYLERAERGHHPQPGLRARPPPSATITLPNITIAKSIVGSSTVPIGTGAASQVTYRLTVTVPANNLATGTGINRLRDFIRQDGLEYVTGSTLLTDVSGTPPTPALFSDLTNNMNPTINWTSPNPGSTLTWAMRNLIDNSGQATAYVFQVDFQLLATGLITPVSQGGSATDPANWRFWPNTGGNPTLNNTANNDGDFRWSDSFQNRTATSNTTTTTLQQPYMEMSKTNDKVGPPEVLVKAGDTVDYTITASNTGRSASYDNVVVDTLPAGMRDTDPSATVAVTVNGVPVAFTTGWNGGTGELTVTVNAGVSVPAGQDLVVTYTGTVDGDVGSGATLTNNAYIEYRSESGAGRHVTENDDSTGRNKASSQVRTPEVTSAKTALDTPATIGDTVELRDRNDRPGRDHHVLAEHRRRHRPGRHRVRARQLRAEPRVGAGPRPGPELHRRVPAVDRLRHPRPRRHLHLAAQRRGQQRGRRLHLQAQLRLRDHRPHRPGRLAHPTRTTGCGGGPTGATPPLTTPPTISPPSTGATAWTPTASSLPRPRSTSGSPTSTSPRTTTREARRSPAAPSTTPSPSRTAGSATS